MVKMITRAELKDSTEYLNEAIAEINTTLRRDYDGSQSVISVDLSKCNLYSDKTIKCLSETIMGAGYRGVAASYGNNKINSIYITM